MLRWFDTAAHDILHAISALVAGPGQASATGSIMSAIIRVLRVIVTTIDDLFQRERQAWTYAETEAAQLSAAVRELASDNNANWSHFIHRILPHSQSWMIGAVHRWADGTFLRLSWLKSKQWVTVRDQSRTGYELWRTYHYWLHGFVRSAWPKLMTWKTRTADPQLRQLWALNPHAYPLEPVILDKAAAYLHSPRGQTDLKSLTALIVDESPQVWRHVESAIIAFLDTPYP